MSVSQINFTEFADKNEEIRHKYLYGCHSLELVAISFEDFFKFRSNSSVSSGFFFFIYDIYHSLPTIYVVPITLTFLIQLEDNQKNRVTWMLVH